MRISTVIVAALATTAMTAFVDAKCAMTELTAHVLTPDGDSLPPDGGVLVGWRPEVVHGPRHDGDPSWAFSDGNKPVEIGKYVIAPGVMVYRPKTRAAGPLSITEDGKPVARFVRSDQDAPAALAAPLPTSVKSTSRTGFRNTKQVSLEAQLSAAPPDAAFGVITYSASRTAISFAIVGHDGGKTIAVYSDPGHCAFHPGGMRPAAVGDMVTFAWVDRYGRMSKESAPIAVAK